MNKQFKLVATSLISIALLSSPALALDLNAARSKGLVKELPNGYLEAADASAKALAEKVNAKRKAHYEKIAKQTKVDAATVAKQAAKKIQEKLKKK